MGISSYIAGASFAVAWLLFIDGYIYSQDNSSAKIVPGAYVLPGIFGSIGLLMLNVLDYNALKTDSLSSSSNPALAKGWLFFALLTSMASFVAAIWIAVDRWLQSNSGDQWPGIAIVLQNIIIFLTAVVWWWVRSMPKMKE
eukprot:ANDGO_00268.mRNA.1 Transmembrane protein 50 homolog